MSILFLKNPDLEHVHIINFSHIILSRYYSILPFKSPMRCVCERVRFRRKREGELQTMIAVQAISNSITMNPFRTHAFSNSIPKTEMQWCLRAAWSIIISYCSIFTCIVLFYFPLKYNKHGMYTCTYVYLSLSLLHTIRTHIVNLFFQFAAWFSF